MRRAVNSDSSRPFGASRNFTFTVVKERNLDLLARAIGRRDLWVKPGDSVTVSFGPHAPMVKVNRQGRSVFTWPGPS